MNGATPTRMAEQKRASRVRDIGVPGWRISKLSDLRAKGEFPRRRRGCPNVRAGAISLAAFLIGAISGVVLAAPADEADPLVKKISLFKKGAGRVAWSAQGDWLAFDKEGSSGHYQLWTMKRDGTFERCLTCDPFDLRKKNSFNPTWHPSGDYLVFQVQNLPGRLALDPIDLATGNRGLHSDLWLMTKDGKSWWQITRSAEQGGAVLDPHFSHEGNQLLWSERVRSRIGRWGRWVLRVAEIKLRRVPRLGKPRTFNPRPQHLFMSGSGFTPDDQGALVAGNLEPGQGENGMDVYRLGFERGSFERLSHTQRAWDEKAHYTVKGDRILWISANEITLKDADENSDLPFEQLRDLWVMDADGDNKQRLTRFNDDSAPESMRAAIVDDFAQSPGGDEILAHVIWSTSGQIQEGLYLIELNESFRR